MHRENDEESSAFLSFTFSAPVRYVLWGEEQVSAAPGMSWHGGLSSKERR